MSFAAIVIVFVSGCAGGGVVNPTVDMDEPSGLGTSSRPGHLWIVSDTSPTLQLVTETGHTVQTLTIDLPSTDFEGITELDNGNVLIVDEGRYELVEVDPADASVVRITALRDVRGYEEIASEIESSSPNKGLEGIAVDAVGNVWVAKEADPTLLIRLTPDRAEIDHWVDPSGQIAASVGLTPDDIDISGLATDPLDPNTLWVLSHEAATLFEWDISQSTVTSSHPLDASKPEGIGTTPDGGLLVLDENDRTLTPGPRPAT